MLEDLHITVDGPLHDEEVDNIENKINSQKIAFSLSHRPIEWLESLTTTLLYT